MSTLTIECNSLTTNTFDNQEQRAAPERLEPEVVPPGLDGELEFGELLKQR